MVYSFHRLKKINILATHTTSSVRRQRLTHLSLLAGLLGFLVVPMSVSAGTLTTPRDYLNRQIASQTTGIQHEVFFTATNNVSGGAGVNKVTLTFPDSDNWCATAGSDLTVTGITNPTGATESASALPGTLSGACAQSSQDTVTITGVDNLTGGTKYGVRIADGATAKLGSPVAGNNIKVTITTNNGSTDIDSGTYAVSILSDDQVLVSASIEVTLSVSLDTTSVNLGTLDATNINKGAVVSTVSTSAASGYVSLVKYDNTLTSPASDTIPDTAGGTIVAGASSEYGVSTSDASNTITQWSPASCTTGATTSNASALTTTFQSFASNTVGATNEATTLCFMATVTATQAPGTYTSTATLVTTGRF